MSDLIRRLRLNCNISIPLGNDKHLYMEAADEIECLTVEVKELREKAEALEWLVKYYGTRLLGPENVPSIIKQMIEQKIAHD